MSQFKLKGYSIDNLFFFFLFRGFTGGGKGSCLFFLGKVKKRELSALFTAKY